MTLNHLITQSDCSQLLSVLIRFQQTEQSGMDLFRDGNALALLWGLKRNFSFVVLGSVL